MSLIYYHVVTEKPMKLGQKIIFDRSHHSGVYKRVYKLKNVVDDIYQNPIKYQNKDLSHHTKVALRELALEEIRQKEYPNCPSRLSCLYVTKTLKEAESWYDYFIKLGRKVYQIVKVSVDGNTFTGNANNCFDGTIDKEKNLELAKRYWENKNFDNNQVFETIASGKIEVVAIIKENMI